MIHKIHPVRTLLLIVCLLLLVAVWYLYSQLQLDRDVLTNTECTPPCWNSLIPGVSTRNEVDIFLNHLNKIIWTDRRTVSYPTGCETRQVREFSGFWAYLDLNLQDNNLTFIQSSHYLMPTVGKVVHRLGPPEYIQAVLAQGPEDSTYSVNIYYPHQGIAFELMPDQKDAGELKENTAVWSIHYFPPGNIEDYFINRYSCSEGAKNAQAIAQNQVNNFLRPWKGFGQIEVIKSH